MMTAEECLHRAEVLERLAEEEPEEFRRKAYRQMAAYWRDSAEVRTPPPEDA